jgi:protein-S-isoprenylcysteine O-methyltransferase Ste14
MTEEDSFRALVAGIVVLSAAVYAWHRARLPLAQEQQVEPAAFRWGRPIAAVILFSPVIVYVCYPSAVSFAQFSLPSLVREFCGMAAVLGLGLLNMALLDLGTNLAATTSTTLSQKLVTEGAFQWMRHPLYAAALYLLIGCAFLASNALMLAAAVVMFVLLRWFLIPEEERRLLAQFGEEYEAYRRKRLPLFPRW